jgi:hypothetical protein
MVQGGVNLVLVGAVVVEGGFGVQGVQYRV